jgi:hypothetical protein
MIPKYKIYSKELKSERQIFQEQYDFEQAELA